MSPRPAARIRTSLMVVLVGATLLLPTSPAAATGARCAGRLATIVGTSGDDTLQGTPRRDIIVGLDGDDTIDGAGGHDVICGGAGDDRINGGPGVDVINGGAGADQLIGDDGSDTLRGGPGRDRLFGGVDGDALLGGSGRDVLYGDSPEATSGGTDALYGGAGDDSLYGGPGPDTLIGGAGIDLHDGGEDPDLVRFPGRHAVEVDLVDQRARTAEGDEPLVSVQHISGSRGDDVLRGDAHSNRIEGGAGDDLLVGRGGRDAILGSGGRDRLRGGSGSDDLYDDSGDIFRGGSGQDALHVVVRRDGHVDGGKGRDLVLFDFADHDFDRQPDMVVDLKLGTAETSSVIVTLRRVEGARTGGGDDVLRGTDGPDYLHGSFGNDRIVGRGGDDELWGYYDTDTIVGDAGNDVCYDDLSEPDQSIRCEDVRHDETQRY